MSAPEAPVEDLVSRGAGPRRRVEEISGWGGARPARVELLEVAGAEQAARIVAEAAHSSRQAIPRGMGRSYGDAAQREGGVVLGSGGMRRFSLDAGTGLLEAEAGATLGEILKDVVPRGWMVPVVPGTQHVSVGGAIAGDVHGKNHGAAGTFARHVEAIGLLTGEGEVSELIPADDAFWATAGGMGLTGLILWARIRLRPIPGPLMSVDVDRVADLDGAFAALSAPGGPYRVAWLDLVSSAKGRGFVTRADHLPGALGLSSESVSPAARVEVPSRWPGGVLRTSTVRAFNELRYRATPRRSRGRIEPLGRHLFPLDVLSQWPRLYGPGGFLQYQFVVPFGSEDALRSVVELLDRRRLPPYLVVLKDFVGPGTGGLSFPIPGWTVALDLPCRFDGLGAALDRCDELVAEAGGRVYLSKDVRMRRGTVEAMYPELGRWREIRDELDAQRVWCSDLAVRTGLLGGGR